MALRNMRFILPFALLLSIGSGLYADNVCNEECDAEPEEVVRREGEGVLEHLYKKCDEEMQKKLEAFYGELEAVNEKAQKACEELEENYAEVIDMLKRELGTDLIPATLSVVLNPSDDVATE